MDSGWPVGSVDQSEASSPPCWRVQLLSDRHTWKAGKSRRFSLNNIVLLFCGLGFQSPRLPSREAKGIYPSPGSAVLSLFDGLMHGTMPVMTRCLLGPELNCFERRACVRACVCVRVCVGGWVCKYMCVCVCVCARARALIYICS